jgi:hypothetical protein
MVYRLPGEKGELRKFALGGISGIEVGFQPLKVGLRVAEAAFQTFETPLLIWHIWCLVKTSVLQSVGFFGKKS